MAVTGPEAIVASLSSSELHLQGKRATIVLKNMMDDSFEGTITEVRHGQHVPAIVFTFDEDTIFSGRPVELTGDVFNNLVNHNLHSISVDHSS